MKRMVRDLSKEKIIARVLRWAAAMIGMEYSKTYRYDWFKKGSTDCSGYVFAMWLAGLFPLQGIKSMTSMYEVYAEGFDLVFPDSYDNIGKSGYWAPKGFYKTFPFEDGDTVFMNWDDGTTRANKITHVLIYSGGKWLHTANTREDACFKELSYGDGRILAVIRLKDGAQEYALPDTTYDKASATVTRILQAWLNYHGAQLRCDGVWGPKTAAALDKVKLSNGISGDGNSVDKNTWNALLGEEYVHTSPADKPSITELLKEGMRDGANSVYGVAVVQQRLIDLRYNLGKYGPAKNGVDGEFGPKTDKAVRKYQRTNGLKIDGIVGPKTRAALGL